jgi:hypothetical protein
MQLRHLSIALTLVFFGAVFFSAPPENIVARAAAQEDPPCVFDNFVWFKEQDIISEIRKDLPGFNGTAPENGEAIQKIIRVLERMLKARKLPSQVGYNISTGAEYLYRPEHIFSVSEAQLNVCKIEFSDRGVIPESELQSTVKALLVRPYSRFAAREQVETMTLPVYKKFGYLRVQPRMPQAEPDGSCKNGVALKLMIEPGPAFVWEKAAWSGNKVYSAADLDAALAMKPGEVANGQRIDAGLADVLRAYGKLGYAAVQINPQPQFNDGGKRVSLNIAINEGAQFKMGQLAVAGISETSAAMFKELWRIKPGEVYDATYLNEFLSRLAIAGGISPEQIRRIKTSVKPDSRTSSVNVLIDFNPTP